jgi:hypothetical protein
LGHDDGEGFRRIALSLEGAEEGSHMGAVDFRVGGRIFATLASVKEGYGNLMLTPEMQAEFLGRAARFVPAGSRRMGTQRRDAHPACGRGRGFAARGAALGVEAAGGEEREAGEDLRHHVVDRAGRAGQEDGARLARDADFAQVSKYCVMRTMAITSLAVEPSTAPLNCSTEACRPLMMACAGDAVALQRFRFGFGFGLLDLENLVGFAAGLGRDLLALRGVDVVHGGFDFGVGNDVGDQRARML